MITGEHIHLSFSGKEIFGDLNFQVKHGEKVCFSGESGRGKTTLLKILQGYIIPNAGILTIDGTILSKDSIHELRTKIAWVPQNINLPVNSGKELLKLMEVQDKQDVIYFFMDQLGLKRDLLQKGFKKISGGQKQRIIMAICFSLDKELILMDEPTASLDDHSISLLISTIKRMEDKTLVSASHNATWLAGMDKTVAL